MAKNDIKILGFWGSPNTHRVQIALNIKSISYEFIEESMDTKSELLLKSNPVHKKVPVLIHGDKSIAESLVIVQYIDEFWNDDPFILPSDPHDRATARFWAAYISDWFLLIIEYRLTRGEEAKAAVLEKIHKGLVVMEEAFVKISKGKAYFGGDNIGYIDIALGSLLGWLRARSISLNANFFDQSKAPELVGCWAGKFLSNPAVIDVIPTTERLLELVKMREKTN